MRTRFIRLGICLILCLPLCVALGYVGSVLLPREYYSKVTMEVDMDRYTTGERFPFQFQILQSKEMLYPVIDELGLVEKWSAGGVKLPKEQVYFKLLKMLVLRQVRDTDLIEIGAYSTGPQEAANIANTIAVQYRKRRFEDLEKMVDLNLNALKDEMEKQRKKVEEAKAELMRIAQVNHIPEADTNLANAKAQASRLAMLRSQEKEAQSRVDELTAQLNQIAKISPDPIISPVRWIYMLNPADAEILFQYQDTMTEEGTLINAGVGEDDPRVKDLRSRKEDYRKQLESRIGVYRKSLTARLQVAQADLNGREKDLAELLAKSLDSRHPEYIEAKERYFEEKKLLDKAEPRYEAQKMEMPINVQPVKIWEKAEQADVPSRPRVWMVLFVSAGIGLLFAIPGVVLLIVGLCMKRV